MSKLKWTKFEIIRLRTIFILTLPFAFILSILRGFIKGVILSYINSSIFLSILDELRDTKRVFFRFWNLHESDEIDY